MLDWISSEGLQAADWSGGLVPGRKKRDKPLTQSPNAAGAQRCWD